ncbi:MAG: hypothetical protein WKF84_20360 [Pyrinomonadaceae bacterium]
MRKKWRLRSGSEAIVIVRRSDLFPEETSTFDQGRLISSIDGWLKDPLTRQVITEIDESVHGLSRPGAAKAGWKALQQGLKKRIEEAFKRGAIVGVADSAEVLTQSPHEQQAEGTAPRAPPPRPSTAKQTSWIEIELVNAEGQPIPDQRYRIEVPDGTFRDGNLDKQGKARVDGIDPGQCEVSFPDLDGSSEWAAAKQ